MVVVCVLGFICCGFFFFFFFFNDTATTEIYTLSLHDALPIQRDVLMRRRAVAWVLENPGSAMRIQAAKLLYMWGVHPFWNGAKQTLFGNVPSAALVVIGVASL